MDTSTLKEIEEMQLFLESDPPTEPQAMSIRLSELSVRMARSSYLLAMAKYEQDLALIKASRLKDLIPLAPQRAEGDTQICLRRGEQDRKLVG